MQEQSKITDSRKSDSPLYLNPLGITFIELIVVVMIIGIVTAASLVSFAILTPKKLEADARRIVDDLCWAREMAVTKHANYIVDFDIINERYDIYEGSITSNNLLKRQVLEVDLVSITPVPARLTFAYPLGTSQSKQINLNYQGKSRQVTVLEETGYVKMQ